LSDRFWIICFCKLWYIHLHKYYKSALWHDCNYTLFISENY